MATCGNGARRLGYPRVNLAPGFSCCLTPDELMTLSGLLDAASADPALRRALRHVGGRLALVAPPALRPLLGAALTRDRGRTVLMVTATEREADDLTAALSSLLDPAAVAGFPAWETLPHERLS